MRAVQLALRILALILVGVAGGLLTAEEVIDKFQLATWLTIACIAFVALLALTEQLLQLISLARAASWTYKSAVTEVLESVLLDIADASGYSYRYVGASAFRVKAQWWRRESRHYLAREGWRRFSETPQRSDWRWTPGVGLLGVCWKGPRWIHKDLREAADKHGDGKITEAGYAKVSTDLKNGMPFEMFADMIGKYGEVGIMPIKNTQGQFLGCLAVDVASEGCPLGDVSKLDTKAVRDIAAAGAAVLAKLYLQR